MAKPAKQVEVEVSTKLTKKFVGDMLAHFANIESERGKFMRYARGEKDAMTALYEMLAAQGVPQKSSKTHIKIIRALDKIKGWMADLEDEDRKMAWRLAQAQGDKQQLSLWASLPTDKPAKKKRTRAPKQTDMDETWAKAEPAGQA
jgi:hypothetical protein